jgi:hypothetical protein
MEFTMTQPQGIVKGDALQKIGSAGFIIGAILMTIGGSLMPHASTPTSNLQEMLRPLGEQLFNAQFSVLLLIISIWATMSGVAAVYRSIASSGEATRGAAWARLGFYFMLVGTVIYTVALTLDASTAGAVANWLAAPAADKEAAYSVIAAVNAVGRGLYPVALIAYWVPFAFLGIAMLVSAVYPRSLGWSGVVLGSAVIALGIVQSFTPRTTTLTLIFMALSLLTGLWGLVVGIWVARKA